MSNLWTTTPTILLVILATHLIGRVHSIDNLRVAYEWKEIDFKYASAEDRWSAIERDEFKPENVIPFGIEVYQSRLFVTLPRWRDGVPASLAYLDLNDVSTKSPALIPYPSWEAHNLNETNAELVSPFRVRADHCGRLWVLDSRIAGILEDTVLYGPAQLLIYDLHNDNLLRRHVFPHDQVKKTSFYANLAIEDGNCDDTFAYAADLGSPGLVVYSWKQEESWRVQHNYFHPDPLAGNFSIGGLEFQWDDGLYGLALSKTPAEDHTTLYFHALSSTMEFSVDTKILHNKSLVSGSSVYKEFKVLGARGANGQAGVSFWDPLTGVLFYTLPNLNAIGCWKTSNEAYTMPSQGRVYVNPTEMVFPSDLKVDQHDHIWVLSNRLHEFIYGEPFPNSINFRILTAHVKDAIANTVCDSKTKIQPEIFNEKDEISNTSENSTTLINNNQSTSTASQMFLAKAGILAAVTAMWLLR